MQVLNKHFTIYYNCHNCQLITNEMEKEGLYYEREKFRSFMKEVDFLGKKTLIHSLDEGKIITLLKPIFKSCYN